MSDDRRRRSPPGLDARRRVAAPSLGSIGALGVVTAYQTGLVRHLPEPPLRAFDAHRVDASGEAYHFAKVPDGSIGILNSAVTLILAGIGGAVRAWNRR